MPRLSKRVSSMSPSPTVALNAKAKELRTAGNDVLNFAVGEPDYGTPKPIVDVAIKALQDGKTGYGPAGGSLALRTAIQKKLLRENGLNYDANQIVCGIGAKEILFHLMLAILDDDDEVLLPAPAWVSYAEQIKAAGAKPVMIPWDADRPLLDPAQIEEYATERTVAFVITTPNNPAGYAADRACLETLGSYLKTKENWWVVSDEIYEYMSFDQPHVSLLKVTPELQSRFIYVNGLAKGFAMTGWRVGYTAAPPEVAKLVKSLQSHSSTCLPPFIEEAATHAIDAGPEMMADKVALLKKRRDLSVQLASEIDGIDYIKPQGAFYLFIDIRQVLSKSPRFEAGDSLGFGTFLLEEHLVAVVPGEAFGCPGYLRFSYAADMDQIKEGMTRLAAAVATATEGA